MNEEELLLMDSMPTYEKPNKKQKQPSFMKHVKGIHWKNSPDQEWADMAKESYKRISERQTWKNSDL